LKPWKREVHERCNYTCQHCGVQEDPKRTTLQVHHIIPRSKGGTNDPSNTTLLCNACHKREHGKEDRRKKYYDRILKMSEAHRLVGKGPKRYRYSKGENIHKKARREIKKELKKLC